ncbi:MAG: D-alanyl-D-alanine endopeptidase [Pseudomonadota bacterium]
MIFLTSLISLFLLDSLHPFHQAQALGPKKPAPCSLPFNLQPSQGRLEEGVRRYLSGPGHPDFAAQPPSVALLALNAQGLVTRKLFESHADLGRPMASIQKVLTAWIATRALDLETPVLYTSEDDWFDRENDGNPAKRRDGRLIQVGETATVRELVQTLLEQSSNAAASALARASRGSHQAFVREMNDVARSFLTDESIPSVPGAFLTHFQNPSGLTDTEDRLRNSDEPGRQQSTAHHFARLAGQLLARAPREPFTKSGKTFKELLDSLQLRNETGKGVFQKYGWTHAAGATLLTHWQLPEDCQTPEVQAIVLTAFGGLRDPVGNFVLEAERLLGLDSLRYNNAARPSPVTATGSGEFIENLPTPLAPSSSTKIRQ